MIDSKFGYWRDLSKSDPELFEQKRQEAIDEVINNAAPDNQHRLRQLQWRIDMERRRAKNPMDSCVRIYDMMWKKTYDPGGLKDQLDNLTNATKEITKLAKAVADGIE